jgi:hypothetical protein
MKQAIYDQFGLETVDLKRDGHFEKAALWIVNPRSLAEGQSGD